MNAPNAIEMILSSLPNDHTYMVLLLLLSMGLTTLWALRVASSEWESQEAAQRRYHALLEQVSDGVVTVPLGGGDLLSANNQAAEFSGYPAEELKKLSSDYIFPSDHERWMEKASRLGEGNYVNVALRRGSGEVVYINANATTVREDGHKVLQIAFHLTKEYPSRTTQPRPTAIGHRRKPLQVSSVPPRSPVPSLRPPTLKQQPSNPTATYSMPVEHIMHLVAESFGMKPEELSQDVNSPRLTMARRVVMYLATQVASIAPEDTGRILNGRSQVAVLYGARLITDLLDQDPGMRQQVEHLQAQILASTPTH